MEQALKPADLVGAVIRCLRADRPAMVHGAPGIGKTEIIHTMIGPAMDLPVWDFRVNSKEPVDLRGLPYTDHDTDRSVTRWACPEDLPTEPALLFIDEINTAHNSLQAPLYQVVQEKRLGNWVGHPDTRIIAAGNRERDRAVAHRMSSALSTRFGHYDMVPDPDQWCLWASRSGRVSTEMIGFIRFRPELLNKFDPDARTSPIPRTVEAADRIWQQHPPASSELVELAAHVGEGFATEFLAYAHLCGDVPDIDMILENPTKAALPPKNNNMSVWFATAAALSARITYDTLTAATTYLDRLGEEFSVFAMRDALARDGENISPKDKPNPAFIKWGTAHADMLG